VFNTSIIHNNKGFTLAEVAFAAVLSLLLLGFIFAGFNRLAKALQLWQQETHLENIGHQTAVYPDVLMLYFTDKASVSLKCDTENLLKNNKPMLDARIKCLAFMPKIATIDSTQSILSLQFKLANSIDTLVVQQNFTLPHRQAWAL
jgi:hypothetical protein